MTSYAPDRSALFTATFAPTMTPTIATPVSKLIAAAIAVLPRRRSIVHFIVLLVGAWMLGPNLRTCQAMQQVETTPPVVQAPHSNGQVGNHDHVDAVDTPAQPTESRPPKVRTGSATANSILRIPLPPVFKPIIERSEWIAGPTEIPVGNVAKLRVPAGYRVSGKTTATDWMKLWRGKPSDELAIVLADDEQTFGIVTIKSVQNMGNLEPAELDPETLLASLQSRINTSLRNKLRRNIGINKETRVEWTSRPVWNAATSTLSYGVRRMKRSETTAEAHVVVVGKYETIRLRLFACDATIPTTIPSPVAFQSAMTFADEFKRANSGSTSSGEKHANNLAAVNPAMAPAATTAAADASPLERLTISSLIDIPLELRQVPTTTKPWFFFWIPDFAWAFVPDRIARLGWFEWLLVSAAVTTGWRYLRLWLVKMLVERRNARRSLPRSTPVENNPRTRSVESLAAGATVSDKLSPTSDSSLAAESNPAVAAVTSLPPLPAIPAASSSSSVVTPPPIPGTSTGSSSVSKAADI